MSAADKNKKKAESKIAEKIKDREKIKVVQHRLDEKIAKRAKRKIVKQ